MFRTFWGSKRGVFEGSRGSLLHVLKVAGVCAVLDGFGGVGAVLDGFGVAFPRPWGPGYPLRARLTFG